MVRANSCSLSTMRTLRSMAVRCRSVYGRALGRWEDGPVWGGWLTSAAGHATKGPAAHVSGAPRAAMTRDDLERLDLEGLRALARKHLAGQGRGLETRGALLAELAVALGLSRGPVSSPGLPRRPRNPPSARAVAAAEGPGGAAPPGSGRTAPPGRNGPGAPAAEDAPVEEGFFAVRPSPRRRRRSPVLPPSVRAGPAPVPGHRPEVAGEVPKLLARDPNTLFLFWDFRRDLAQGAAMGLLDPQVLFHVFEGDALVRTLEVPLERRSAYLEGLLPGHTYHVEAWFSGREGHARPTGRRSAPLTLPAASPSASLEVRVVRTPGSETLAAWQQAPHPAPASRIEPVGAPARVDLPASLEWRGGPGPGGPRSGRP